MNTNDKVRTRKWILLLLIAVMLTGCNVDKQVEQNTEGKLEIDNNEVEGTRWFSQLQRIIPPEKEQGFGGWKEGTVMTEDFLYYIYQPTTGFDKCTKLYRVPLERIFSDNILLGAYPAVQAVEVTEELPMPEELVINWEKLTAGEKQSEFLFRFFTDAKGQLYYTSVSFTDEESEQIIYLYRCDKDGKQQLKLDITESIAGISTSFSINEGCFNTKDSAVDAEDRIYLADRENKLLWILDKEGALLHKVALPEETMQQLMTGDDGRVYLVTGENETTKILQVDADGGELPALWEPAQVVGNLWLVAGDKDKIIYSDKSGIHEYDGRNAASGSLLPYADNGISGENITLIRQAADGKQYILEGDYLILLVPVEAADIPAGKEQVTLAVTLVTDYLRGAVVEFNKKNAYYEVILEEYPYDEGQQRLETELATGKAPDLFAMGLVYVEKLVDKGLIADLTPYLEDGRGMERKDLVETVLRCNTIDGVLTCVPHTFSLDILQGKKSVIGDSSRWSVEQFLDCVEKNAGMEVAEGMLLPSDSSGSRSAIVRIPMRGDMSRFADYETGKAFFQAEEFLTLLETAKNYVSQNQGREITDSSIVRVQEGKVLFDAGGISSVEEYMLNRAALQQDICYVGYPAYDGKSVYGIRNGEGFGMNAASEVKDGAWAFIEFMLTYNPSNRIEMLGDITAQVQSGYGFPVREAALSYALKMGTVKAYERNQYYDVLFGEDGNPIEAPKWKLYNASGVTLAEAYAATEEEMAELRSLIEGASCVSDEYSNTIYQIVYEEVLNCLGGGCDVRETSDIIQNRVQLYLNESR